MHQLRLVFHLQALNKAAVQPISTRAIEVQLLNVSKWHDATH